MTSILIYTAFILISLTYTYEVLKSIFYIRIASSTRDDKRQIVNKITILIPMYKESTIAGETVQFFSQIASRLHIEVFFITTEKEGAPETNATYQIIYKAINGTKNLHLLHYPNRQGDKAAQINWAADVRISSDAFLAIFDADSRPDYRGISYVQHSSSDVDVFQMPSIYLPHQSNSIESRASAIFQTRWTYCFEIPRWIRWQHSRRSPLCMYLVGHGLFIKNGIRFPEDTITEDLKLGYKLSSSNVNFVLVPFFDYAYTPKAFSSVIVQSSRWFYGELLSLQTFYNQYRKLPNQKLIYFIRATIRYAQVLLWLLGPTILLLCVLISTASSSQELALFSIGFFLYILPHGIVGYHNALSIKSLALVPIRAAINSIGPMLCIYNVILDRLKIKKIDFISTKR